MSARARVLIAGCGDLGTRLGLLMAAEGAVIHGLRRSPQDLPEPIQRIAADLGDARSLQAARGEWDCVVFAAAASERSEAGYRHTYVDGLQRLLDAIGPVRRMLFVSSTAVFGQDQGEWVDEDSPTEPSRFNGRLLLEAEQRLRERLPQATVVRPSGLYGPGRTQLIQRALSGDPPAPRWTNRIHIQDAAAAIRHILAHRSTAPLWLLNDERPASESEVFDHLRRLAGLPPLPSPIGEALRGRRVSCARLRDSGFRWEFPDFRAGYREVLPARHGLL